MRTRGTRFELDRGEGKLFGVCAGIARSTGIDATIVRVAVVLLALFGSFTWTAIAYGAAALYGHFQAKSASRSFLTESAETPERVRSHELRMRAIETYTTSANSRLAREIEELR
jgi:phage shock protein PspC (stress-responsive transcriptional regulator)